MNINASSCDTHVHKFIPSNSLKGVGQKQSSKQASNFIMLIQWCLRQTTSLQATNPRLPPPPQLTAEIPACSCCLREGDFAHDTRPPRPFSLQHFKSVALVIDDGRWGSSLLWQHNSNTVYRAFWIMKVTCTPTSANLHSFTNNIQRPQKEACGCQLAKAQPFQPNRTKLLVISCKFHKVIYKNYKYIRIQYCWY